MTKMRVQKFLAEAGFGSRRSCEEFIRSNRVTVNGQRVNLGQSIDPDIDEIRLDGERVNPIKKKIYILVNKPLGVLSSHVSQGGHPTVIDLVGLADRVFPVGRLDLDSEGLILLTNDGALTHKLTHPSFGHEKEYRVLLNRHPDPKQLTAWRRGIVLSGGQKTTPAIVRREQGAASKPWIRVILRQGFKRQIRETARTLGLRVVKLIRIRIGPLRLKNLEVGEWRYLRQDEIDALITK
jgi:23S rRNA pseudouridine2605 synthase